MPLTPTLGASFPFKVYSRALSLWGCTWLNLSSYLKVELTVFEEMKQREPVCSAWPGRKCDMRMCLGPAPQDGLEKFHYAR